MHVPRSLLGNAVYGPEAGEHRKVLRDEEELD